MTTVENPRLNRALAQDRHSRRHLLGNAATLGLPFGWIGARAARAIAAPAPTLGPRRTFSQDDRSTTLLVAVESDLDTFDPAFAIGSPTGQTILQNTYDQLTQYRVVDAMTADGRRYQAVDTRHIDPMLCSSWRADGANLVFTLRDGLTFANGNPLDATVIRDGFRRIFETGGLSSFLLSMGGAVTDSAAFSAPDRQTFVISMSRPNDLIPQNLVMLNTSALDPREIARHRTDADPWATEHFRRHPGSGSGPYIVSSYHPADAATLTTNPRYAGPRPSFTTVTLKVVPDTTARAALLHHGEVDLATALSIRDVVDLEQDPEVNVLAFPSTVLALLCLNGEIPPFNQSMVRQAVAAAVPYQSIIDRVYRERAQPAPSLVPTGMPTSDSTNSPFVTDVAKARALFAAAGYPDGAGLPQITLSTSVDSPEAEPTAFLIEAALRDLGVSITIRPRAPGAFNQEQQAGRLQCWLQTWFSWVNDPYYHLFWLAHSQSPANFPRLHSDRVDELIDRFVLAEAGPDRDDASREAQALANAEANYLCLCQPDQVICSRRDIVGHVRYHDELTRFARLSRIG